MSELVFFFASFGIVPALATAFALRWAVRILRAHRWSAAVFVVVTVAAPQLVLLASNPRRLVWIVPIVTSLAATALATGFRSWEWKDRAKCCLAGFAIALMSSACAQELIHSLRATEFERLGLILVAPPLYLGLLVGAAAGLWMGMRRPVPAASPARSKSTRALAIAGAVLAAFFLLRSSGLVARALSAIRRPATTGSPEIARGPPTPEEDLFPIRVGNRWTYSSQTHDYDQQRVRVSQGTHRAHAQVRIQVGGAPLDAIAFEQPPVRGSLSPDRAPLRASSDALAVASDVGGPLFGPFAVVSETEVQFYARSPLGLSSPPGTPPDAHLIARFPRRRPETPSYQVWPGQAELQVSDGQQTLAHGMSPGRPVPPGSVALSHNHCNSQGDCSVLVIVLAPGKGPVYLFQRGAGGLRAIEAGPTVLEKFETGP
jgi:hypothetical protein